MTATAYRTSAVAAVAVVVLGLLAPDASLLLALLFWAALLQGVIAWGAATELSQGRWFSPAAGLVRNLYPLLLLHPIAFLLFARNVGLYGWTEHPTWWLSPGFWVARNVAMLLLVWLAARAWSRASQAGSASAGRAGVIYLLTFVISQSLIAFDWVMSFDWPWISTLFGGYFFVEALYGGLGVLALVAWVLVRQGRSRPELIFKDVGTFIFAFSLLWAGQFFAQYLVIWYGNMPEEQAFLVKRILDQPGRAMGYGVLAALFFIPFIALLGPGAKRSPWVVLPIAGLVFAGILLERIVFLFPVAPLNPLLSLLGLLVLGFPLVLTLRAGLRLPAGDAAGG